MEVERITTVIRLRQQGEAIDLGFRLVREYALRFYLIWFVIFLPIPLLVYGISHLFFPSWDWVGVLVVWWLKPLYDPLILYFFSRALFGEFPSLRQTLREIWSVLKPSLLVKLLFFYRFSLFRAVQLPVWQLEGLKGKAARQRLSLLKERLTSVNAARLLLVCLHFEWILYFAPFFLIKIFFPNVMDMNTVLYFYDGNIHYVPSWLSFLEIFSYLLAISIVEPLYVVAGFSLYLNRRTQLEGWDIELAFHRIVNRLGRVLSVVLWVLVFSGCVMLYSIYPTVVLADTVESIDKVRAKQEIERVLAAEEFQTETTVFGWRSLNASEDSDKNESQAFKYEEQKDGFFSRALQFFLWILLGIGLAIIVYGVWRWMREQSFLAHSQRNRRALGLQRLAQTPTDLSGLPDNIALSAWACWQAGEQQLAISLLYRGTLKQLSQQYQFKVRESATEQECLQIVRHYAVVELVDYFAQVCRTWQCIAYAHQLPSSSQVQQLCHEWQRLFVMKKASASADTVVISD
ncbi:hypothetical protein BegalDRAFT_2800 [Beggiatoa alba B18LD]|uniref:Protein-glutamine gamma-glutamyltransferase-like C-terminal domain-containing protein n=1 Tax=Beggiatoa alba B18LD TaxID=395493 RepID=I3CJ42_9GAMM|nr:DUF4129 domain-containing protein [Beggiatoa alba]EIJ43635.1 hypothetical protein BegalDRAFT_2800 [Beggiatoa alba B18LD]